MTNDQQVKLLLANTEMVKSLAEASQQAGVVILQQRETIKGLLDTGQQVNRVLQMLVDLIEEQRTAINELRRRVDEDDLPPFDRSRFSLN